MSVIVDTFMCHADNYGYLVHDVESGKTAAIDAPEAGAIRAALERRGWTLSDIFVTHHHGDHIEGIAALKSAYGATVTGPRAEAKKIKGLDVLVAGGDAITLGGTEFLIYDTPGHTAGHIVYHEPARRHVFVGDTLFSMGCGRLYEGKAAPAMWESLLKLRELPDDTLVYCGHEYSLANAKFALTVDPGNAALRIRAAEVERMRAADLFTIPVTMGMEKATNPFLRADRPELARGAGLSPDKPPASVFAALRKAKDNFKS